MTMERSNRIPLLGLNLHFLSLSDFRDRSFFTREGGLVGFRGGPCEKKQLSRGGHPKKIREKGGAT